MFYKCYVYCIDCKNIASKYYIFLFGANYTNGKKILIFFSINTSPIYIKSMILSLSV